MLKLFGFIRPFRAAVAMVMALAFAQSLANLYLPRLMADIVDHGIVPGDTRQILAIGAVMLLVAIIGTIAAVAGSFFASKVATGFGRVVRGRIFDRVAHFSVHQFDHFSSRPHAAQRNRAAACHAASWRSASVRRRHGGQTS